MTSASSQAPSMTLVAVACGPEALQQILKVHQASHISLT